MVTSRPLQKLALVAVLFYSAASWAASTSAPTIVQGLPAKRLVKAGARVRFEVTATSDSPIGYQWHTPGPILAGGETWIETTFESDDWVGLPQHFYVSVYNRYGSTGSSCEISTITRPIVEVFSTNVVAAVGQQVSLVASVLYGYPATFQWHKDGAPLPAMTNLILTFSNGVTLADAGIYTLLASNEASTEFADSVRLRVLTDTSLPIVLDPPAEIHMTADEHPTIEATAYSAAPVEVFAREQDGTIRDHANYYPGYQVRPLSGSLYFFATNDFGSVTSRVCQVTVHAASDRIVFVGGEVKKVVLNSPYEPFELQAELLQGADVTLQWYRANTPIVGENSSRLKVLPYPYGESFITASNVLGVVTQRFAFFYKPTLEGPVAGWVGPAGDQAILRANGTWKDIQWWRDGVKIDGATNASYSLTISSNTVGTYTAVLKNDVGETVSNPATVTMREPSEARRDYRLITGDGTPLEYSYEYTMNEEGLTFLAPGGVFHWTNGIAERLVDANVPIPGLEGTGWGLWTCSAQQAGVVDILMTKGFTNYAVIEKSASAIRVIAQSGDLVPGSLTRAITAIGAPVRAGGKVAFVVGTTGELQALLVWDGSTLRTWVDSEHPSLVGWAINFQMPRQLDFDGEEAVFSGRFGWDKFAIYRVNAAGQVQEIARAFDPIPGTSKTMLRLYSPVAMNGNKTLFKVDTAQGDQTVLNTWHPRLLEHSPDRQPPIRVIAGAGAATQGGLTILHFFANAPWFGYGANGDIIFTAATGNFQDTTHAQYDTGLENNSILRWSNGQLLEELTPLHRLAGRKSEFVYSMGSAGNDYVIATGLGVYTTLNGTTRPTDTFLRLNKSQDNLEADWAGGGILQGTHDLINWVDLLYAPGSITNDLSKSTRLFRIYHP